MSSDDRATPVPVRTFQVIVLLAQQMRTLMDQRLRPDGLTTQQAAVLTAVDSFEIPPTLSQVAAALSTSHQNARQIADALQRKGLLEYDADPADARVRRLRTTTTNADYWARRNPADHEVVAGWFAGLSPTESRTLHDLLARVETRVGRLLAGEPVV
jgi:DNA-binding MarR family transcriptional regulator